MTRTLLETRTNPDPVTGQVAQPSSSMEENHVLLFTALMASSFFIPVLLGIYWWRATREGAAAAMAGGVTITFLWEFFGSEAIDPVLPGFLASAFLMIVVSLVTPPPPQSAIAPYFPDEGG